MTENSDKLDLDLWLNKQIIPRQNKLKAKFWEILAEVGNSVNSKKLTQIHPKNRGAKLSRGNDLLGYPYQVLDLIRDFETQEGLNIRILNWFGHGIFIFILIGREHPKAPVQQLSENEWAFDLSSSPWDYPEIILQGCSTHSPTAELFEKSTFYQWHKSISIPEDLVDAHAKILDELKKLIFLLS